MFMDLTDVWKTNPVLVAIGFAGAFWYGVQKAFETVENKLTPQTKQDIAFWLLGLRTERRAQHWSIAFTTMFDRVSGQRHLSWKCFRRSFYASFLAVVIVFLLWTVLRPAKVQMFIVGGPGVAANLVHLLEAYLAISLIPDYISLLETRWVLSLMKRHQQRTALLLCVDFILTAFISCRHVPAFLGCGYADAR
jgi:hypothetical protein